jgi:hypothetical protein
MISDWKLRIVELVSREAIAERFEACEGSALGYRLAANGSWLETQGALPGFFEVVDVGGDQRGAVRVDSYLCVSLNGAQFREGNAL